MTQVTLRFGDDGTFAICQFTDLHLYGAPRDANSTALMRLVLDAEHPDLVVLTGDTLGGRSVEDEQAAWDHAAAPMIERGIPWAAIYGNHDAESKWDRQQQMDYQRTLPGCLSEPGPAELPGVGNYILKVAGDPGAELIMLDSHDYADPAHDNYAWVEQAQIDWLMVQRLQSGYPPALLFLHIPLPEYERVWEYPGTRGARHESICCPKVNSGLFAALKLDGAVYGVFCGHDHINDFDGLLEGIRLVYGRGGGYHTYGREGFLRGARLIRLHEGRSGFDTWLRLSDGSLVQQTERVED